MDDDLLELVKDSLRITGDDLDKQLRKYIAAAKADVKSRVGSDNRFFEQSDVFPIAVEQQAVHFFRDNSSTTDVNLYVTELGFNQLIIGMKAAYWKWEKENG